MRAKRRGIMPKKENKEKEEIRRFGKYSQCLTLLLLTNFRLKFVEMSSFQGNQTAKRLEQPHTEWVLGLSPRLQRPGREADYSPPCSTKLKNARICTFNTPHAFMTCTGANLPP